MPFEEHVFKTHLDKTKNCNMELPKEGEKLACCNSKNLL